MPTTTSSRSPSSSPRSRCSSMRAGLSERGVGRGRPARARRPEPSSSRELPRASPSAPSSPSCPLCSRSPSASSGSAARGTGSAPRRRGSGRGAAEWIGAMAVGGGYWYVRNLIVSGTPFPWQDIGPIHHAEALQGRHPYSIAHYATDTSVWRRFFTPALHERLGELWPAYLALAVIAVLLVLWRGGRMERMLAVVALLAAVAYLRAPLGASGPESMPIGFRLNIRYLAPGLVLALTLLAIPPSLAGEQRLWRLGTRAQVWRYGTLAILAVLVVVSAGAIGAIDTGRIPGTAALALAVIALPLLLVLLSRRGMAPVPLAGSGLAARIALAVCGRLPQTHYLDERSSSSAAHYPKTEQPAIQL